MKITLDQYPGFVQNIETIGSVDLSDNDQDMLIRLAIILNRALVNVRRTLDAHAIAEDRDFRVAEQNEDPIDWPPPPGEPPF